MGVIRKSLILLICTLIITGCATIGQSDYYSTQPADIVIKNELILDDEFDIVWDRLVKKLASGFYVINNIDKSSRIINVSFASNTPDKYVDCGTTHRTYERGSEYTKYDYKVASSCNYKMAKAGGVYGNLPVTLFISRKASLDGRVNIYVAPIENGTLVTVNCKYVLTIKMDGYGQLENAFGSVAYSEKMPTQTSSVTANTNSSGFANWGDYKNQVEVKCISLGILEAEILDFARP
jgi:hypothetical protein